MKKGDLFAHKYFIGADGNPIVCLITAIRLGWVYYRLGGGTKMKQKIDKFVDEYREVER